MAKVISIFNQSGGVAKTTLTHNLGWHLGQRKRVLLVDLDPQSSLTSFMGLVPSTLEKTVYHSVVEHEPLTIKEKIHACVDLVPANVGLSAAEKQLVSMVMREFCLKNSLLSIIDKYDFVLIDCPPSLGLLAILSLVASTHVLVPIQTQAKSFEGTDLLLKTIAEIKRQANRSLSFAGFVPTLYDKRTIHQYEIYQAIKTQLSQLAPVHSPIPHTIAFPDSSLNRMPLALYKANHPAVNILESIAQQLEQL